MWPWDFSQGLFSQRISNFPERGILRKALPDHSEIKEEEIHNYIWKNKYSSAWKNFKVLVTWSCPTLCNLMNSSPPGSSVHGILQARTLEWVAFPFSRASSQPRDWIPISCIAGKFFTIWARQGSLILNWYLNNSEQKRKYKGKLQYSHKRVKMKHRCRSTWRKIHGFKDLHQFFFNGGEKKRSKVSFQFKKLGNKLKKRQ